MRYKTWWLYVSLAETYILFVMIAYRIVEGSVPYYLLGFSVAIMISLFFLEIIQTFRRRKTRDKEEEI